eukprot:Skav216390  [mRNA]  locus=scaffold1241:366023:371056:+ [translate_table: standard]
MEAPTISSQLDPDLGKVPHGTKVSVVALIQFRCPGATVCATKMSGQVFLTDTMMPSGEFIASFLNAVVEHHNGKVWLRSDQFTRIIIPNKQDVHAFDNIVEACSGIDAVAEGYAAAQCRTVVNVEHNQRYADYLRTQKQRQVVEHDVSSTDAVVGVAEALRIQGIKSHVASAGMACQPFSQMGDQRQQCDPRSTTMTGSLALGYLTGATAIFLECTPEAYTSDWVQTNLQQFSRLTQYRIAQRLLTLDDTWAARRTRWWCVLVHPAIPDIKLQEMPVMSFKPSIMHVIPRFLPMSPEEEAFLTLDDQEVGVFQAYPPGIAKQIVNRTATMPTATHSWGSQAKQCDCGCRNQGFSHFRLQDRGIHSVLIPVAGKTTEAHQCEYQAVRHPHPREVAVLNGMPPEEIVVATPNLVRLMLSGVGQMGSPLQSAWIMSQVKFQVQEAFPGARTEHHMHPRRVIAELCRKILQQRDALWEKPLTRLAMCLEQEIQAFDHPLIMQMPDDLEKQLPIHRASVASADLSSENEHESIAPPTSPVASEPSHDDHAVPMNAEVSAGSNSPVEGPSNAAQPDTDHLQPDTLHDVLPTAQYIPKQEAAVFAANQYTHAHEPANPHAHSLTIISSSAVKGKGVGHNAQRVRIAMPTASQELTAAESELDAMLRAALPALDAPPSNGGVRGFEAPPAHGTKRPGFHDRPDSPKQAKTIIETIADSSEHASDSGAGAEAHESHDEPNKVHADAAQHMTTTAPHEDQPEVMHDEDVVPGPTVRIGMYGHTLVSVAFQKDTTVGQAMMAEQRINQAMHDITCKATNGVGAFLPVTQTLVPNQVVIVKSQEPQIANTIWYSRQEYLWMQEGAVADDEMEFYLDHLHHKFPCVDPNPVLVQAQEDDFPAFEQWLGAQIDFRLNNDHDHETGKVFWYQQYWFPALFRFAEDAIHVSTTPDMQVFFTHWLNHALGSETFTMTFTPAPSQFSNDCGFQSIAWLINQLGHTEHYTLSATEAFAMRTDFEEHLSHLTQEEANRWPLVLGGTTHDQAKTALIQMLKQHGVQPSRSDECAGNLIHHIGLKGIQQALGSSKPWADLKSRASQLKPPIRIVLHHELQEMIAHKASQGKQIGSKQTKKKQAVQAPAIIDASEVQVPAGVFQQEDGQALSQISPQQFHGQCRGIAIVNVNEALPFFKLQAPMSSEGLGLVVLDYEDPQLPVPHEVIRFPATCKSTQESMLVTGALLQLGSKRTQRMTNNQVGQIQETPMAVIRAQVYRDQIGFDWQEMTQKPVKTLLSLPEFATCTPDDIVDVWGRQFLNKKFQKTKGPEAELFVVQLRVSQDKVGHIMDGNAREGRFYEPRSANGRQPNEMFSVVWLAKKSWGDVQISKQTNCHPCWLVRSADRYGLRIRAEHAKDTHKQHKPDQEYLAGTDLQTFRVGPLPFSTNKSALVGAFKGWGWAARPGQPLGQTADHSGLYWSAVSHENPSHWVFQMRHGDVLVSKLESNKERSVKPTGNVEASRRTLQHLSNPQDSDPWLQDDPWKQPSSHKTLSTHQIASIEANVHRRVVESLNIPPKPQSADDDEEMPAVHDRRVTELEQKVRDMEDSMPAPANQRVADLEHQVRQLQDNMTQLTNHVQSTDQQQQQHNSQMVGQITAVKHQLEAQRSDLQHVVNQAMEDQYKKLESLLKKRALTDHE